MTARSSTGRPFGGPRVFAPTGTEAAEFDTHSIQELGIPEATLMENAGRSAALLLQRLHPHGPVVVVVGSGNNGGDGLVLARSLAAWGRRVRVFQGSRRPPPSALLHGHPVDVLAVESDPLGVLAGALAGGGVVVDALLGTGVRGAPREGAARWIKAMNEVDAPVLSLDLPSGVEADGGGIPGAAVRARETVAFGWPKLGTLLYPGRGLAGRLIAVEIGFPPPAAGRFGARVLTCGWADLHRPRRTPPTHKNEVGSLLLLAGGTGLAGAAVLAARGALRAGVGYLRVASFPENRTVLQTAVPGAVFVDATDSTVLAGAVRESRALAAGPGLGLEAPSAEALRILLDAAGARPTLLDADALTLAARGEIPDLGDLARRTPLLLTPHPGEMVRIHSVDREELLHRRPEVVRAAAARFGAVVLLKGDPSLVASPEGELLVSGSGGTDLATAGVGDVLTGAGGGFLAQGLTPPAAAGMALHCTGRAAERSGTGNALLPEDVVEGLPGALAEEGTGWTELEAPFVTFDQDPPR